MADYRKRVELLEDDAFTFLSVIHNVSPNISNHQNGYDYNCTYKYNVQTPEEKGQSSNGNGLLYASHGDSYLSTMSEKDESGSSLDIKNDKKRLSDLNVSCGPLYALRVPGYPLRSDIKDEIEYQIPDSNTNDELLFESRVPDMLSSSDLKEDTEYQAKPHVPLYAPVPDLRSNDEEHEISETNCRPLYASGDPDSKSNVKEENYEIPETNCRPLCTSRVPDLISSSNIKEEYDILETNYRPLYSYRVPDSRSTSNIKEEYRIPETNRPLYASNAEYPTTPDVTHAELKSSTALSRSDLDTKGPLGSNMVHVTQSYSSQSKMDSSYNSTDTVFQDPRKLGVQRSLPYPYASQNIWSLAHAIESLNLTHGSQLRSDMSNTSRVPNTPVKTTICATGLRPNLTEGLPQLKPNMFNRKANTTVCATELKPNLAHSCLQLQSNMSNTSSTAIRTTKAMTNLTNTGSNIIRNIGNMPILTNVAQNTWYTGSNTTVCSTGMRPDLTLGASQIQSNMSNRAPTNTPVRVIEPMPNVVHGSSQLQPNMFNQEANTGPNTTVRATEPITYLDHRWSNATMRSTEAWPNPTYRAQCASNSIICSIESHIPSKTQSNVSNTVPNRPPTNTTVHVTEPQRNLANSSPQLRPNMSNEKTNTGPYTAGRAIESRANFASDPSQLKSNISNRVPNTAPTDTFVCATELRPNRLPQLEPNISNREPNKGSNTTFCGTDARLTHCTTQFKPNLTNRELNTARVTESGQNLTHEPPKLKPMCNKHPNNTGSESSSNSTHGSSQLQPNMDPYSQVSQITTISRNDADTRTESNLDATKFRARISNESQSNSKRDKLNFFDWEQQLREAITTPNNDRSNRNCKPTKVRTMKKIKRTIGRRIKTRYICKICSCIYKDAPIRHLTKQHSVKADSLWKHIYVYIKCQFCLCLFRRQSYKNHLKTVHNRL